MKTMMRLSPPLLLAGLLALAPTGASAADNAPFKVKVVVVTTFEVGNDTGDMPGEFQHWVEGEHLDKIVPLPGAYRDVRVNEQTGVIGLVVGEGTAHSATSIMALGLDPRFDLREAYWLMAGIAGIDPADASLGSAAWAEWVVDGDLAHLIDPREMPKEWSTGYFPLFNDAPYPVKRRSDPGGPTEVYHLNGALTEWAYQLTKDVPLPDNEKMKSSRARYTDMPNAQRPPFVLKGDNLAGSTFWHGKLLDQRANDWVKYWTEGKGNYVTTAMEDSGLCQAMTNLSKAGKADFNRLMVLRTASNFDSPPPGRTAVENLAEENSGVYSAFLPSLESAYLVGGKVVHEIADHWDRYEKTVPSK